MNRINNGKYKTKNQFGNYTDFVNDYINQLYDRSLELYLKRYTRNNSTGTQRIDIEKIEESLGYIEDYLFYFYQFNNGEFFSIFKNLIDDLKIVTVFPPEKRGLYGQYSSSEKVLYINPQLYSSQRLSSDERTRLYICHELGHIQNSKWMKKLIPILNGIDCSNEDRELMYDGFSLLDEATTQDRAENITYYFSSKLRPGMSLCSTKLFSRKPFETNFDYYGEFQLPTIDFARTLRGIGKIDDRNLVMNEFDKRALNEEFSKRIFDEYINDNQIKNLFYLVKRLGVIKNASYAVFGYGNVEYLRKSSEALKEYNQVVGKMRDYREPIVARSCNK